VNHKKRSKDMTRKDYIMIAKAISNSTNHADLLRPVYLDTLMMNLCNVFREDNPRFDEDRFITAVAAEGCTCQ
jgi:hypothetical protein